MASTAALFENLLRTRERLTGASPRDRVDEELPLRAELFSADQMEQHGKALAASHSSATSAFPTGCCPRLAENERLLSTLRPADRGRQGQPARSRRPASGCSTIST